MARARRKQSAPVIPRPPVGLAGGVSLKKNVRAVGLPYYTVDGGDTEYLISNPNAADVQCALAIFHRCKLVRTKRLKLGANCTQVVRVRPVAPEHAGHAVLLSDRPVIAHILYLGGKGAAIAGGELAGAGNLLGGFATEKARTYGLGYRAQGWDKERVTGAVFVSNPHAGALSGKLVFYDQRCRRATSHDVRVKPGCTAAYPFPGQRYGYARLEVSRQAIVNVLHFAGASRDIAAAELIGEGHRIEGPADAPQPGQTILFDLAHLATSDLQYNLSIWSSLKGTLAGRGYTLNHHATGALTGAALQGQDVLVIQDPQVSFSAAEKTAVVDFANAGGGLLIAGEWGPAWPNGVVIELLNLFGASYDNVEVWDQTHFIVVPEWVVYEAQRNFLPHPALGQVAKIVLPAGSTMSGTPDWSTVVETDEDALPARRPIAMARGFGGGRVFALGDTSVWYDHHIDKYDNRAFGVNVMEWLLFRL